MAYYNSGTLAVQLRTELLLVIRQQKLQQQQQQSVIFILWFSCTYYCFYCCCAYDFYGILQIVIDVEQWHNLPWILWFLHISLDVFDFSLGIRNSLLIDEFNCVKGIIIRTGGVKGRRNNNSKWKQNIDGSAHKMAL